jgi:hypothetical protein
MYERYADPTDPRFATTLFVERTIQIDTDERIFLGENEAKTDVRLAIAVPGVQRVLKTCPCAGGGAVGRFTG